MYLCITCNMSLQLLLPNDLLLSLLLRCSSSDLLRLQRCSHHWYDLLRSDRCVDYLLRHHCRLTASQLSCLDQPTATTSLLFRLLPCLASVEVHSLAGRSIPPLHRALLAEAVLHSPLSVHDLSLVHEQPTSLLPWLQIPNSPLLRLQLHEIVQLADCSHQLTLHSLRLPAVHLWLTPRAACWQQRWDDYWLAAMHAAEPEDDAQPGATEAEAEAKSEYDERSEWMAYALEQMANKHDIGRLLDLRVRWIGHIQESPCQPPAVFGYYLGSVRHRQHVVPATMHHNPYTVDAAYSDATAAECGDRLADVHLDVSRLPVVVADLTASMHGLNGHWLHAYDSLGALLHRHAAAASERVAEVVRSFIEEVDRVAGKDVEQREGTAIPSASSSARRPLYLSCFPGADRPQWR